MGDSHIVLPRDPSFIAEVWIWYGIGLLIITLRYIARIRSVGFRGFQGDDYIALLSLALYTADAVLVDICCKTTVRCFEFGRDTRLTDKS